MVLLTASTISAAISGIVICLFTFLLFLSGYVLQQKTVRSLQEALAAPLEVRVRIAPTLSAQLQNIDGGVVDVTTDDNDTSNQNFNNFERPGNSIQVVLGETTLVGGDQAEPSPQELWHTYIDSNVEGSASQAEPAEATRRPPTIDALDGRYAYVFTLPNPADLCSAILFTSWSRQTSHILQSQLSIVFLYPSDWETTSSPIYTDALRLLLQSEHKYSVLLHPVPISKVWTGIDVESQLLSELARNPWPYDRVMYLRSPGMLLDTTRLDNVLISSYADPSQVKSSWTKLRPPVRRGLAASSHPDILLFAQGRGLMTPIGDLQRTLTGQAKTRIERNQAGEIIDAGQAKEAAYILFDGKELMQRKKEEITEPSIFERFERERQTVCSGTNLLAS